MDRRSFLTPSTTRRTRRRPDATPSNADLAYVDFLTNLSYLQASYYAYGSSGSGLPPTSTNGSGHSGTVTGGAAVAFGTSGLQIVQRFALDLAGHVATLRSFRSEPVALTDIDFNAFNLKLFVSQLTFFEGAFVFCDLVTSAFYGAAASVTDAQIQSAIVAMAATLGYHAGAIRTLGATDPSAQSSIDSYSTIVTAATSVSDYPIVSSTKLAISNTNASGYTLPRTPQEVLVVLFGGQNRAAGGFFPSGVNGSIVSSG